METEKEPAEKEIQKIKSILEKQHDQKLFKELAKYKIVECLKETFAKPIESRRFLWKKMNPLFSHKNLA